MTKKFASAWSLGVIAMTLFFGRIDVAFGDLTTGNQFNMQFDETLPTPTADHFTGTFALGAAVAHKPGVFRVAAFDAGGTVFGVAGLLFNANTVLVSGTTTGLNRDSEGVHTWRLTLSTTDKTWTLTDTSRAGKSTLQGTYTLSAVPALSLYDSFNTPMIDPAKWSGGEYASGGAVQTEAIRIIQRKSLRLMSRRYGSTDSDSGRSFSSLHLDFASPASVTAIRAVVQVINIQSIGCADNTAVPENGLDVGGFFFNTGTPTPGDATGDVLAVLEAVRVSNTPDHPLFLQIVGNVLHCTSADCTSSDALPGSPVALGQVSVGVPIRLFIGWDKANKQFLFQRNNAAMEAVTYTVSDSAAPGVAQKRLQTFGYVSNCTATAGVPRPNSMMDVRFHEVEINAK